MKSLSTFVLALACAFGAFADDPSGNAILRLLNSRSSGSPKGYAEAAEEVAAEAAAGRLLQGFVLAIVSREVNAPKAARLDDRTREQYLAAARGKIESLAKEKNNPLAWYLLSLDNNDTNMLELAAIGGNAQALNAWGTLRVNWALSSVMPSNEVERVLSESCEMYRKAAGQGDANGLYNLGMCYSRGLGVARDDEKAFTSFRAAAEKGHPEAINSIGWFFREGRVVPKDDVLATKWFAKSAAYRNPFGEYNYALALLRGQGVKTNPKEAAQLLKRASDGGCIEATNTYGVSVSRGDEGFPKDAALAFKLFERAAAAGYPPAMENLAGCYERGEGVAANDRLALEWKIRSRAARGDRNAMAWLHKHGVKF